ncbi:esterase [Flavobacterium sp. MAH-1]|uniref:Esterase n=1 Tax=Flavobacterium agri TaxID=2743471 RepID=A0A7Y8Y0C8_9FLAO|nr:esterase [Flavobacterium agri]NUY80219.1 esterase [Flavobacterium agri]NYA70244.1 esterase [Flavobacterium agri]
MKNCILLFLLFGWTIYAQENVSFGQQKEIISPEINADNSVTFRLDAKEAKKVSVQGDFLPPNGFATGSADLVKGADGIWSFTTSKLASELYSYWFVVDGVKVHDPNNAYLIRDVATIVNIFIIGNGKADDYKTKDVPHGSVVRRWYDSPTLKLNRRVTIYTPPGYETSKESYPTLYLLHGAGGDEEAWIALGRTAQIMDNLIAQKKAKPMLVVMTNGNASQTAAPGESSSKMDKPVFLQPDMFSGNTERAYPDVVKFIESNYRVKKDKANRAIAGLSMGGMHSLVISANNPDTFDYVGVFSSAMLQPKDSKADVYASFDQKLKTQKDKGYKLYWIAIGKTDFLYKQDMEFRERLDSIGFKYTYKESEGGHTWSNWRDYLTEFAPKLFN